MKFYMCGMFMCSYAEQSSILRSVSVETETSLLKFMNCTQEGAIHS